MEYFAQKKSEIQSDVNQLNAISTKLRQLTGKSKPDYIVVREVDGSGIQSSRVNTGQSISPSDRIPEFFSEKVPQIRDKINKIAEEIERMTKMYEQLSPKFKDLQIVTIDFSGDTWPKEVQLYYSKYLPDKKIDIELRNYEDGRLYFYIQWRPDIKGNCSDKEQIKRKCKTYSLIPFNSWPTHQKANVGLQYESGVLNNNMQLF